MESQIHPGPTSETIWLENKNVLWWQKPTQAKGIELDQLIGKTGPITRLTFLPALAFRVG